MLTTDDNDLITRVGPGTPMGELMREYWIPGLLSSEVPTPDCDPVRVRLLGEDLIAFRDTAGRVGLIQNLCPHRGASLFFGRNEERGLRCVYHGWKFDVDGACVDMPNEPPESSFKDHIRAAAYPCEERGGAVFVYMGKRSTPPPLPKIEAFDAPGGNTVRARMTPCNWLQVIEGNIDTVHTQFLHRGAMEPEWFPEGSFDYYHFKRRWATFVTVDTEVGAIYGAYRPGPDGTNYWRIGNFMFPCWSTPGAGVMGYSVSDTAWVPMDDTHTMVIGFSANSGSEVLRELTSNQQQPAADLPPFPELLPNTTDWYGRFRSSYGMENDFLIDRSRQRSLWSFTGMPFGASCEDRAVQESMGPILPREIEHLGTSDAMVIRVRQRLLEAVRAFIEHKVSPPGVDQPDLYLGRVGQVMIPVDADWLEFTEPLRQPYVDHGPLDPRLVAGSVSSPSGTRYVAHSRGGPMF